MPGDSHVHSQFSWDTLEGDMAATCARALDLGLPYVAFTEHVDLTDVVVGREVLAFFPAHVAAHVGDDLVLRAARARRRRLPRRRGAVPRPLPGADRPQRARDQRAALAPGAVADLLAGGRFDRLLGSLHSLTARGAAADVYAVMHERGADVAMRDYLAEAYRLASSTAPVAVLAHVDYPVREWSRFSADPYDPFPYEDELREVLTALAASGRALELSTVVPLAAQVLRWWRECGGTEVTFASDAHRPDDVARGFADAAALAEAVGFGPRRDLRAPWCRG